MSTSDVGTIRDYAEDVFYRGRRPMEPHNFQPNWPDQPSKHKTYLGVDRLPLPVPAGGLRSAADVLLGDDPPVPEEKGWTLDAVASMLRLSYGVLDRRLRVGWNQDSDVRIHYNDAMWGRGTASGGGMYPLETYWVAGPSGPLVPGVYHYSTAHHALERLVTGDVTDRVRAAVKNDEGAAVDQFLLVAVRFWKNAYKYNSFCYHVVTQDAGALLGSWEVLARGLGLPLRRVLWFADEPLNDLLGLPTLGESVLAVVPLTWQGGAAGQPAAKSDRHRVVDRPHFERSRNILRFNRVEEAHRATLVADEPRPPASAASAMTPRTGAPAIGLPPPLRERLHRKDIGAVFAARRSSFGAFLAQPPLALAELGTVLAGAASATRYASDVKPSDAALTRLYVLANRVTGLAGGTYAYAPERHELEPIEQRALDEYLQRSYYLSNYNLDQVAAVLAISANLESALAQYGGRGYRILNAEVGAVVQTAYLAAGAADLGCGAVLGFDNLAIDEIVGLDRTDERTFLFLLLGHERTDPADYDYRLV